MLAMRFVLRRQKRQSADEFDADAGGAFLGQHDVSALLRWQPRHIESQKTQLLRKLEELVVNAHSICHFLVPLGAPRILGLSGCSGTAKRLNR